jgi:hypothetical protein
VVACVRAERPGFLAVIREGTTPALVADVGAGIETSTPTLEQAIALGGGADVPPDDRLIDAAIGQIDRWLSAKRASDAVDLKAASAARFRRATLTRVARVLARTPRHRQSQIAPLVDAARGIATAPLAEGAERILETLVAAELPDEAWLRSIAAFGELNVRRMKRGVPATGETRVVALIVLTTDDRL